MLICGSCFVIVWNNIDITASQYVMYLLFSYNEILYLQVDSRLLICSSVEVKINAEGIEVV